MEEIACCQLRQGYDLDAGVSVEKKEREGNKKMNDLGGRTIRVEPEKPIFLLLIGTDIDQGCCPLCAIDVLEFFQKDLDFLSVWSVLGDQMEALGFFDR